jgi:predicted SprT family Zn-dependent metalloprotease
MAQNFNYDYGAEYVFQCNCYEVFDNVRMFQSHITRSGHCGGIFNKELAEICLRLKVEEHDSDDDSAQCIYQSSCFEEFDDRRMFQSHIAKSGHCGGLFNGEIAERHKRVKTEEFEFVCDCRERFADEREFQSHVSRLSHCGGVFNRIVSDRCRRPVIRGAKPLDQGNDYTNDGDYAFICECYLGFYDWKPFRNHVTKSRHCGGVFNSEVCERHRVVKTAMATPHFQEKNQAASVEYEFVCNCSERFSDEARFERHVMKSGHFQGHLDSEVLRYCKRPVVARAAAGVPVRYSGYAQVVETPVLSKDEIRLNDIMDTVVENWANRPLPTRISASMNPTSTLKVEAAARPDTMQKLGDFISGSMVTRTSGGNVLAAGEHMLAFKECTLMGTLIDSPNRKRGRYQDSSSSDEHQQRVFLNTHEPFCLVTVGVQGGGKSHTLATVLEGCLIPFPEHSLCRLEEPMTTLVLHYDDCSSTRCEVGSCRA